MDEPATSECADVSDAQLEQTIEALLAFAHAERFAVEAYDAALCKVGDAALRTELARLRESHWRRAAWLEEQICTLGGPCREPSGPWGAFANAFRRIAEAGDELSMLAALLEGEVWGVRDYEIDLDEVAGALRREVAQRVLPEQRRTSERVAHLARGG